MCGIAGYSVGTESQIDRTLATQALLAGIAERGADAVGYAVRGDGPLTVHKQQTGASAMLETIAVPSTTRQALVHVRDYTKGHPTIAANNHPVRHGSVVGIHNGIISNDEELFAGHEIERHEPEMTVDSEAIFALVDGTARARMCSSTSSARWRPPGSTSESPSSSTSRAASGARSGSGGDATRCSLLRRATRSRSSRRRSERRSARRRSKRAGSSRSWTASSSRSGAGAPTEATARIGSSPAVRAPHEGRSCLDRLAAIAAPATG